MINFRRSIPLLVVALLAAIGVGALGLAQQTAASVWHFSETNHNVREPFLSYFREHGGVALFGYPLTEQYTDPDGVLVQTFQNAQLQLTVRGVGLAPIGLALHLEEGETQPTVAEEIRAFYEAGGGIAVFGPPISAPTEEGGKLVQDFEGARLAYDPVAGETRMTPLGSVYLALHPPPNTGGQAEFYLRGTPTPPPAIRASVHVAQPTVGQGGQQTIYLYVYDEAGYPVSGAQALAVLRYDIALAEVEMARTDEQGLSSATFIVPPASPGSQVLVEMHVLVGDTFLTVQTAYIQWW